MIEKSPESSNILIIDIQPAFIKGLSYALRIRGLTPIESDRSKIDTDQFEITDLPSLVLIGECSISYTNMVIDALKGHQIPIAIFVNLLNEGRTESDFKKVSKSGIKGIIDRASSIIETNEAIGRLLHGKYFISPSLYNMAVNTISHPHSPSDTLSPEQLTDRELDVARLLNLSNKEIAVMLEIKEKTVKTHVSSILSKFGVDSRTRAALILEKQQLISWSNL